MKPGGGFQQQAAGEEPGSRLWLPGTARSRLFLPTPQRGRRLCSAHRKRPGGGGGCWWPHGHRRRRCGPASRLGSEGSRAVPAAAAAGRGRREGAAAARARCRVVPGEPGVLGVARARPRGPRCRGSGGAGGRGLPSANRAGQERCIFLVGAALSCPEAPGSAGGTL